MAATSAIQNAVRPQLIARFELEQRKTEAELRKLGADRAAIQACTTREDEESRGRIASIQSG